jgi:PPK2 family polyphosphate:nucleotide phosphotransferase
MNFTKELRVSPRQFRLKDRDPAYCGSFKRKEVVDLQASQLEELQGMQDRFYAQDRHALLIVLQGMDTAGKDGLIKHVMSGVNPTGCEVYSFKQPSPLDLDHDYLWRVNLRLPERGRIGIFNRSYYEEVLVVRVHPEILEKQKLPADNKDDPRIWDERYQDMNAYELYLSRNGIHILKFFLHISKEEQRFRFLQRLDDPRKNWKFSPADFTERGYWEKYMDAYEEMILATSSSHAPWYLIPSDRKWFARLAVSSIIVNALRQIDPQYPRIPESDQRVMRELRDALAREGNKTPEKKKVRISRKK